MMGKTLDSVLFASADLVFRADQELNNFYDKPGKTVARELAKHLAPMYTANRASNVSDFFVPIAMVLEIGKSVGYAYIIAQGFNLFNR